jgi:hypothetical protein
VKLNDGILERKLPSKNAHHAKGNTSNPMLPFVWSVTPIPGFAMVTVTVPSLVRELTLFSTIPRARSVRPSAFVASFTVAMVRAHP